jgi:WD40 repeat protein
VDAEAKPDPDSGPGPLVAAALLPNERTIVVTAVDDVLRTWDLTNIESSRRMVPWRDPMMHPLVTAVTAISHPDGRTTVVSAGGDKAIRLWDLETMTPITLEGVNVTKLAVATSAERKHVVVGACEDTRLRVWDAVSGAEIQGLMRVDRRDRRQVTALDAAYVAGQLVVVTARGKAKHVRRWPLDGGVDDVLELSGYEGGVTALALAAGTDPPAVVIAGADDAVRVLDLETGKRLLDPMPVQGTVRSIACLPNEPGAVIAGDDVFALVHWSHSRGI